MRSAAAMPRDSVAPMRRAMSRASCSGSRRMKSHTSSIHQPSTSPIAPVPACSSLERRAIRRRTPRRRAARAGEPRRARSPQRHMLHAAARAPLRRDPSAAAECSARWRRSSRAESRRSRRRRAGLVEIRVTLRRRRTRAVARLQRGVPPFADRARAGDHLGDRTRRGERLEARARARRRRGQTRHRRVRSPRSRTPRGSASMSVFKSLDRSTVVTSTSPFSTTTTRSDTPYMTTSRPAACTTLSRASTAWTRPCMALPGVVVGANALERAPGADVVPAEIARQHATRSLRSSTPTSTDTGVTAAKKPSNVVRVRVQRRRDLRRERRTSSRKSPTRQTKMPEFQRYPSRRIASARARSGFSTKRATRRTPALELVARLDVAKSRIGARGNDADGDERVMSLGDVGAREQRVLEPGRVGDGPIGVDRHHDGVRPVAPGDLLRRPRERGRGSAGARLGDEVFARNVRQQLGDRRHQRVVREYQDALGRRDGPQPRDRLGEQRLARRPGEGAALDGSGVLRGQKREPTPPARTTAQRLMRPPRSSRRRQSDELGGAGVQFLRAERLGQEIVGAECHGARCAVVPGRRR